MLREIADTSGRGADDRMLPAYAEGSGEARRRFSKGGSSEF